MSGLTVVARDHRTVAGLIISERYGRLSTDVGCARQTLSQLAHRPGKLVSVGLAARLEQRFGYQRGELFVSPGVADPEVKPYLLEVAA